MFKSCCVCMSKKVIENHSDKVPPSAQENHDERNADTGHGRPAFTALAEESCSANGAGCLLAGGRDSSAPLRAAEDESAPSTEKKFDACAEIKEEIDKLQAVEDNGKLPTRNDMEHNTISQMSTIMEGSSPSERSLNKETGPGGAGGDGACRLDDDSNNMSEKKGNSVAFSNEATADDSDDEDSELTGDAGPSRRMSSGGILKRPSIAWPAEERPEEDDDVFVAPPARKQSLPAGLGGGAVGRDELALRRHRVFSELVGAARAAAEHRVRFDPLGPLVATGAEGQRSPQVSPAELERLFERLERVVSRLERVAGVLPPAPPSPPPPEPPPPPPDSPLTDPSDSEAPDCAMSVQGYQDIVQGPLAQYISLSNQIGGDVATHATLVQKAFQAQLQFLTTAMQSAQPATGQVQALLTPTSQQIQAIQDFREKNRVSPLFNHLSAISESIPALGWVAVSPTPGPYVKEMNDAGQFYTNRVLKDWKEKDKKHVDWCKSWVLTLTELHAFVKQHHTTGLVWAGRGSCPPPPPCGPPPPPCPPPVVDFGSSDQTGDERNALFAQINKGEDITKSLKKVTSDMQTHKNTTLREGPAPFRAPAAGPKAFSKALPTPGAGQVDKPPVFSRDGKKWLIEYQKGNAGLVVEDAEMNNVVYMFKCRDSALTVKGKINSIVLDSCTKCAVVFDSLVASVEFVNCQSVQMQVLGKVPTVSVDKTDGCQMYLSVDSLDVEIVSSKSSEMNVMMPKGNGDYTELPIPEQFKTTINKPSTSLVTVSVENNG